jgi:hypothetical protein
MESRKRNPKRGSQVILTKLLSGFTDDLPLSDQKAISRIVGKSVQFVGFTRDGRAELEFVLESSLSESLQT